MIAAWMLYAIAIGVAVSLVGLVIERVARARGWAGRWGWALALTAATLLPVLLPAWRAAVAEPAIAAVTLERVAPSAAAAAGGAGWPGIVDAALGWGWLLSSSAVFLVVALSALALRRSRAGWRGARLGGANVLVSSSTGPALLGWVRSTIVVPAWVLDLGPLEQRLIVLHEQEHARARDPLLLLAAWLAVAAAPWNLALWWQLRRLRLAVEIDCDARVLRTERDVHRYGVLLLEVARRASSRWMPVAAFAERSSFLERRIRVITGANGRAGRTETVLLVLLAITTPLALFGGPIVRPADVPLLARETGDFVERTIVGAWRIFSWGREEPEVVVAEAVEVAADDVITPEPEFAYELAVLERQPSLSNQGTIASVMERLYPRILQDAGVGGTVVTQFVIERDGTVDMSSVKILDSPHEQLANATMRAVERFRFRPGRYKGENVRVLIQMPVTWQPAG